MLACRITIVVLLSLLSACGTVKGPDSIITSKGVTNSSETGNGQAVLFALAVKATHEQAKINASSSHKTGVETETMLAGRMRKLGFEFVEQNCKDFFAVAGENQKWLYFTRDAIGALGTLATTVVSLSSTSKSRTENIALVTGIGYAGIDLYTKNFLFSAENIGAVEDLVLSALSAHQTEALKSPVSSYGEAANDIMDNQSYCAPNRIAFMVKDAIKKAEVVAAPTNSGSKTLATLQDDKARSTLGAALKLPRPVSRLEAQALYWIYQRGDATRKVNMCLLKDQLSNFGATQIPFRVADSAAGAMPPYKAGDLVDPWVYKDNVTEALSRFSTTATAQFDAESIAGFATVDKLKDDCTQKTTEAASKPAAPVPAPTIQTRSSPRISVNVRDSK